jgi:hypothetical protein
VKSKAHDISGKNDRNTYHINGILVFCDTNGRQDLRISPPQTSFSILPFTLAGGLIDPVWIVIDVAVIDVLIAVIVIVVVVIVEDLRDSPKLQ